MATPSENTMDNSSTSTSSDDSDQQVESSCTKEPDPSKIPFHFLKKGETNIIKFCLKITISFISGKSSKEGVLITHECFKFTKNNYSRDGKTWWYTCASKNSHGCAARATIKRQEE